MSARQKFKQKEAGKRKMKDQRKKKKEMKEGEKREREEGKERQDKTILVFLSFLVSGSASYPHPAVRYVS